MIASGIRDDTSISKMNRQCIDLGLIVVVGGLEGSRIALSPSLVLAISIATKVRSEQEGLTDEDSETRDDSDKSTCCSSQLPGIDRKPKHSK